MSDEQLYLYFQQTRNAKTEGYSVVSGVGATMVIYTAVVAMAEKLLETPDKTVLTTSMSSHSHLTITAMSTCLSMLKMLSGIQVLTLTHLGQLKY